MSLCYASLMLKRLALVIALVVCLATSVLGKERKQKFEAFGPVRLDREGEKWAQKTLKRLTLEEKIGQMLLVWSRAEFLNVNSAEYQRLREMMRRYHIGSFGPGTLILTGPLHPVKAHSRHLADQAGL